MEGVSLVETMEKVIMIKSEAYVTTLKESASA
jgi:hypothetical protein